MQGVRANQLVGYGLVIGLNGTGDSLRNAPFTEQSLQSMLDRMGINVRNAKARTRNVAAVIVTAELPAFTGKGARIDVTVSSLGDATSLAGRIADPHAADGRGQPDLRGRAGPAGRHRLRHARARRKRSPRACRPRAASPTAAWWSATRPASSPTRRVIVFELRNPGFQHGSQHRRCDQRAIRSSATASRSRRKTICARWRWRGHSSSRGALHRRGRRAGGAARCAGPRRDRRAHRHDRDRQGRADLHRGSGARQPDRARHRERQGIPAATRSRAARPW